MTPGSNRFAVDDLIGSAHIFAHSWLDFLEKRLLQETVGSCLNVSQLRLLKLVAITESHTIGDVAAFLGVSDAAASKTVDKMVRRRLLRRMEGATDRRVVELFLTKTGERWLGAYETAKSRRLTEILREVSAEELEMTAGVLDRLSIAIVNPAAKAGEICVQCGIHFREECPLRKVLPRTCFYEAHRAHKEAARPPLPESA